MIATAIVLFLVALLLGVLADSDSRHDTFVVGGLLVISVLLFLAGCVKFAWEHLP